MMPADGDRPNAVRHLSAGVFWNTSFVFTKDVLQFGLTMILARLLTPADYGQFAFVSAITTFVAAISFRNFLAHALQQRRDQPVDYDLHVSFALLIQTAAFLLLNITAVVFWFTPLRPVAVPLALMSVLVFVDIPAETYSRILERELNWRMLRTLNMAGFILGAIVSIVLALKGGGLYALLIPNLISPIPIVLHFIAVRGWRFRWRWSLADYREPLRFGVTRLFSGLAAQARGVLETSTIVALLSFAALGIYGRAIGLAQLFIYRFIVLLMTSAYPVLTTIVAGSASAFKARVLLLRAICWGAGAAGLLIYFAADPLVRLIYGHQWLAAIPIVGAAVMSRAVSGYRYAVTSLVLADNQAKESAWLDVLSLAVFAITLPAIAWSIPRFLILDAAGQTAVSIFGLWWLARRSSVEFQHLIQPLIEGAVVIAVVWVAIRFIPFPATTIGRAAAAASAAAAFAIVVRILFPARMRELLLLLPLPRLATMLFGFKRAETV